MFVIKGTFRIGDRRQSFTMKVEAPNEGLAKEKVYVRLGSNHQCKRRFIKLESVEHAKK